MKTCFKCSKQKPFDDFYKHKGMADGYLNKCKECAKNDVFEHRHGKGRSSVLAYDRERAKTEKRRANAARVINDWIQRNPDRRKAQLQLGYAVKSGRITPWAACALPECNDKPEAHHPDYSRPLSVVWLCPAHHKQAHALFNVLQEG